jgi:hypothetical protein
MNRIGNQTEPITALEYKRNGFQPKAVELATQSKAIRHLLPLGSDNAMFLKALDSLAGYLGIATKNRIGTDYEMGLLTVSQFIKQQFGHLNPIEIVEAFAMASAGTLTTTNKGQTYRIEAETYQNFSLPYVGKILRAYSDWRLDEIHEWKKATEHERKQQMEKQEPEIDVIEYLEEMATGGVIPLFCDWSKAFISLEKSGEIKMDASDKMEFMAKLKALNIKREKERKQTNKIDFGKIESTLITECRKLLVITWLREKYPAAEYPFKLEIPKVTLK